MTHALRVSLRGILHLCQEMVPRVIPTKIGTPTSIIYTDAFFYLGNQQYRVSSSDIPCWWPKDTIHQSQNGWGFVARIQDGVYFAHGIIPTKVLRRFTKRRAFIYFLEITAQLISLVVMKDLLPPLIVSFCDNQAGLAALQKGMGRDENINRLLTTTWQLIAARQWHIHMEWVASENNISDKISRHDTSWVDHETWTGLTPDLTGFFDILCKIAQNEDYASNKAKDDLLQLHFQTPTETPQGCIGQMGAGGPSAVEKRPALGFDPVEASTQPRQKKQRDRCSPFEVRVASECSSMSCSTFSE